MGGPAGERAERAVGGLSIVIPTHEGRGRMVAELVDTILAADRETLAGVEVLVVDSSPPGEADELAEACRRRERCSYHRGEPDAASKRNVGARAAAHRWVLFVDSDCLVPSGTLPALVRFLADCPGTVGAVAGPTRLMGRPDRYPWPLLDQSLKYNQCYEWGEWYERLGWATTSNLTVRRAAFESVGGFRRMDAAEVGGEDVDFGIRLTRQGLDLVGLPEAVVEHRRDHIDRLGPVARALFSYGVADTALCRRYPGRTDSLLSRRARRGLYARPDAARPSTGGRPWLVAGARLLDLSFAAGSLYAAGRAGRWRLALRRFRYVDDDFRWRDDRDAAPLAAAGRDPGPGDGRP